MSFFRCLVLASTALGSTGCALELIGGSGGNTDSSGESQSTSFSFVLGGSTSDAGLGNNIEPVPDMNGDGIPDLMVASLENSNQGRVYFYSGKDMELISTSDAPATGCYYGHSGIVGDDYDDDGVVDLIFGSWGTTCAQTSYFRVVSGGTGAELYTTTPGGIANNYGLTDAINMGDLNGDTYDDWITYDISWDSLKGRIWAYSGKDGTVLYTKTGASNSNVLHFLRRVPDRNSDMVDDFLAREGNTVDRIHLYDGATGNLIHDLGDGTKLLSLAADWVDVNSDMVADDLGATSSGNMTGYIQMFSGTNGAILYTITSEIAGNFRYEDQIADINSDGIPDIVAADTKHNSDTGKLYVYSGLNGALIYSVLGQNTGDKFAADAYVIEDINSDGYEDIVVSALMVGLEGKVYFLSGIDGTEIFSVTGENAGDRLNVTQMTIGSSTSMMADVDHDGSLEIVLWSQWYDSQRGKLYIYNRAGVLLETLTGAATGDKWGSKILQLDINQDGKKEFFIQAPGAGGGQGSITITDDLESLYD